MTESEKSWSDPCQEIGLTRPIANPVSDPLHLKYHEDMEGLVLDWDDSANLIMKGVPIALKYWSKVFTRTHKDTWEVLKNSWSNWRIISLPLILLSPTLRNS